MDNTLYKKLIEIKKIDKNTTIKMVLNKSYGGYQTQP